MIIGIDFDNTIVEYGALFGALSVEEGLFDQPPPGGKSAIRDLLRQRPGGEEAWQSLQALAYGPRILEATMADGVLSFLRACHERRARVWVVSHKSKTAAAAPDGPELPDAARGWMAAHGLFETSELGLTRESAFFEPTRERKIRRIVELGCTHFIDDLVEVLLDPALPDTVERYHYSPRGPTTASEGVRTFESWAEIEQAVFGVDDA